VLTLVGIAGISFVISICPSIRMEQLGFHWTSEDLLFDYSNSVEDFQDPLKSGKKRHFTCYPLYIYDNISLIYYQNTFLDESCREVKTYILCSIYIYFFENSASYEMWDHMEEPDAP